MNAEVTVATLTIATTFLFILVTIIEYTRSKADRLLTLRVQNLLTKLSEVEIKVAELEEPRLDRHIPSNMADIRQGTRPTMSRSPVDRRTIIRGSAKDMPPLHEAPPVVTKPTNLCKDDFASATPLPTAKGVHTAPNGVKYTLKSVVIDPAKKR